MEKKYLYGIAIALIVIAVCAYLILRVFGYRPGLEFPKGKVTLVRYYACSLAICTHGCEDGSIVERICLDNDTFTHECNLWCHDVCRDSFGSCDEPGDCCGPQWNLTVSLMEKVPLIGCIENLFLHSEVRDVILKIREGEPEFPTVHNIMPGTWCYAFEGDAYPGEIYTPAMTEKYYQINWAHGAIILDDIEAYEKYGCSEPPGGRCHDFGFEQCLFQGNINIWSDYYFYDVSNEDCADVHFNSTISRGWDFYIRCTSPPITPPELWSKQKINLGETAVYTLEIENQLGSGKKFKLELSHTPEEKNPNCILWKDSPGEEIDEIYVDNGDTKEFYMSCTPTETGTYNIWIDAWPRIGYTGERTRVELVTSDFEWSVEPGEDGTEQEKGKSFKQEYTVRIDSEMGDFTDFYLEVKTEKVSGVDMTCTFDNILTTYTLEDIPDGGFGVATITCNREKTAYGEYIITVTARDGGIDDKPAKIRHLRLVECEGDITVEFSQGGETVDSVESGTNLKVKATGLNGCEDRAVNISVEYPDLVVTYCGPYGWDGKTCEMNKIANTPGIYTVYAFIDKDKDGDTDGVGESATATLEITVDDPDAVTLVENTESCVYGVDNHICEQWVCDVWIPLDGCLISHWSDCKQCCDPQSCARLQPTAWGEELRRVADTSNICCINDEDYHSSGPGSVPCLSPDTRNDNTKTENFYWHESSGGGDISRKPRNLYVPESFIKGGSVESSYTWLRGNKCDNHADCYGGSSGPHQLRDASPICIDGGALDGKCQLPCIGGPCRYSETWIFIKISETSRPVYGIRAECGINPLYIFLHNNATGEWINAGMFWGTDNIRPSGWAWNDIDAMFIGLEPDDAGRLNYVGLLTKGSDVPYCTHDWPFGPDEWVDYFRTVDDGKKCYWNLDCTVTGGGWTTDKPVSTGVGAFGECKCDPSLNSGANCDGGKCEYESAYGGNKFCYKNVECANGGWRYTTIDSGNC